MTTIHVTDDGEYVDEDGVISPPSSDQVLRIARNLRNADEQMKAWKKRRGSYERQLIKVQGAKSVEFDGFVSSINSRPNDKVDAEKLVRALIQHEVPRDLLLNLIAASNIPVKIARELDEALSAGCIIPGETRAWIEIAPALKDGTVEEDKP